MPHDSPPVSPEQIAHLTTDLVCLASTEGYFLWLNDRWTEVLGWTRAELTAKPFLGFVHPDDVAPTLNEVERLKDGEPTIQFDNRYLCKDGSYRILSWNTVPTPEGVLVAIARDVTQRRADRFDSDTRLRLLEMGEDLSKVGHWGFGWTPVRSTGAVRCTRSTGAIRRHSRRSSRPASTRITPMTGRRSSVTSNGQWRSAAASSS